MDTVTPESLDSLNRRHGSSSRRKKAMSNEKEPTIPDPLKEVTEEDVPGFTKLLGKKAVRSLLLGINAERTANESTEKEWIEDD